MYSMRTVRGTSRFFVLKSGILRIISQTKTLVCFLLVLKRPPLLSTTGMQTTLFLLGESRYGRVRITTTHSGIQTYTQSQTCSTVSRGPMGSTGAFRLRSAAKTDIQRSARMYSGQISAPRHSIPSRIYTPTNDHASGKVPATSER